MTEISVEKLKDDFEQACKDSNVQKVVQVFFSCENVLLKLHKYENITHMNVDLMEYFFVHDMLEEAIYYSVRYVRMVDIYEFQKTASYFAIYGTLEYILENYEKAKMYLIKETEAYQEQGNERSVANCMCNMGELLNIEGKYLEAINLLIDAKIMLMSLNLQNTEYFIKLKLNLSRSYIELEEYAKAKKYLDEVMAWNQLDIFPTMKVELYANLGRYHVKLNDGEQAYLYLEEAVEIAEEGNMNFELRGLYKFLGESYEKYGKYNMSSKYFKKFSALAWEMSRKTQKAVRQLAEAELSLKRKENIVQWQREKYLQIVREDEYDMLTNTFSKSYLHQYVENLISNNDKHDSFSIMLIHIENLMDIHETFNFRTKEYILVEVASMTVNLCSDLQIVARIEDDKLAVCFTGENLNLSKDHGGTILADLHEKNFTYEGKNIEVTIRGSLAAHESSEAKDVEGLFRMAELALYQAESADDDSLVVW